MKQVFMYLIIVTTIISIFSFRIIRTILDQRKYASLPDYGQVVKFDPEREGGHLLPNLNFLVKTEKTSQAVRFITNSKGFRNDKEFPYEPFPRTFRILFLGDSYVDGMRTDQTKTIGYLLEKELNKKQLTDRFDRYEVMISGHKNSTNAWYYYQRHGYQYRPNLVLLGVTIGNDLTWDSHRATFVPVKDAHGNTSLEWTGNTAQDEQKGKDLMIPEDGYVKKSVWETFFKIELRIREFLAKRSAVFGYEVPPALYPFPSRPRYLYATDYSVSAGLFYIPLLPQIEQIYSDFEEALSGFNGAVTKTGSRLGVVLFPVRIQLHGTDWNLLKRLFFLDEKKFDLDYPDRRLLAFCQKNGILCTDILPAFKEISQTDPDVHLYRSRGDMHFNEKGQEVAAAELYRFVGSIVK